jgi:hypothetical protein
MLKSVAALQAFEPQAEQRRGATGASKRGDTIKVCADYLMRVYATMDFIVRNW